MSDINWNQKRRVYGDPETGELFVAVETGVMLLEDYVEGGHVLPRSESLEYVGTFTNAQIQNGEAG